MQQLATQLCISSIYYFDRQKDGSCFIPDFYTFKIKCLVTANAFISIKTGCGILNLAYKNNVNFLKDSCLNLQRIYFILKETETDASS